ncbi:MAG: hypothetical protein GY858_08880 [Candidatus Omnitrophica bacterium]|nr:hypothetical protein [Candidatus Omnitrophota bacterium]
MLELGYKGVLAVVGIIVCWFGAKTVKTKIYGDNWPVFGRRVTGQERAKKGVAR